MSYIFTGIILNDVKIQVTILSSEMKMWMAHHHNLNSISRSFPRTAEYTRYAHASTVISRAFFGGHGRGFTAVSPILLSGVFACVFGFFCCGCGEGLPEKVLYILLYIDKVV